MTRNQTTLTRKLAVAVFGAAVLALAGSASTDALPGPEHRNELTFSKAVALPGAVLPPGSYLFEVATTDTAAGVVRVSSRDRRRVYFSGFTHQVRRPRNLPEDRPVVFGEAPAGQPQPITAWYPIGRASGHRFIYR